MVRSDEKLDVSYRLASRRLQLPFLPSHAELCEGVAPSAQYGAGNGQISLETLIAHDHRAKSIVSLGKTSQWRH